jgi:prepilin-type N-terminal cleavage/methylation domain-containing protein
MRGPMRRGFTLIELLLVLTILGLLMVFLLPKFVEFLQRGKIHETRAIAQQIAAMAGAYDNEKGDYPPSDYGDLPHPPNDLNTGCESLVAFLASPDYGGQKPEEKFLINSDEDKFPKVVTEYAVPDAFELKDAWGNPFAYFHSKDYGKRQNYRCAGEAGPGDEYPVEARKSTKTGTWLRPEDFQLISAGKDGEFGTPDDIVLGEEP